MKIAILGTRGIPARYGGFETFAEQLANRLARDGHKVRVYCRRAFTRSDDVLSPGIKQVILPGLPSKHFDTLWHTGLSTIRVLFDDVDIVLICNVANSLYAWIPRLFGKPTVLNVDGLDRKRKKWNALGRGFLLLCEAFSAVTPSQVVTDSLSIQAYYRKRYGCRAHMIAYGAEAPTSVPGPRQFGVSPGRYVLYVSRLEPENNPEMVIRAYGDVKTDWPLVIVGGNSYRQDYVDYLKSIAGRRVIFTGAVYGEGYWILQKSAGVFVSAFEVGGTHPALVEAMAAGNAVLYLKTPEGDETIADAGISFEHSVSDLTSKLNTLISDDERRGELKQRAVARAAQYYDWDVITRQYLELFNEALGH
ncbi:MAG: glycosyltransferase [Terriglobales bacterium]|jgi:glycosyltransferase involved in cell wall biosynthesis